MSGEKERLIVVLGPTAVGKTELSIGLAKKLGSRIISGDSMLVYRGFDIGTAKPSLKEREGVRHELIDILDPESSFNVTDFLALAREKITEANKKGELPVLAGGTGLYIKALLEGYEFNKAGGDDEYRAGLAKLAEEKGRQYLHDMLAREDPKTAARLHINDFRRVVRALEVCHFCGERISTSKAPETEGLVCKAFVAGLRRDRAELYGRINRRVDIMLEAGLVDEVRGLLAGGVPRNAQALKGIGYKEILSYLDGEYTLEQASAEIKKNTRHFAKRQFTWYRKMPYIRWYDTDRAEKTEILEQVYSDAKEFFDFA